MAKTFEACFLFVNFLKWNFYEPFVQTVATISDVRMDDQGATDSKNPAKSSNCKKTSLNI